MSVIMSHQVICSNPQIILNPLVADLVAEHGNYTLRGHEVTLYKYRNLLYDFKVSSINPKKLEIKREDLDSCFVTSRYDGEHFPLYLEVPCGHCEVCKNSKINAFVHRCKLETMCYDCKPLFLTLTYDEEHRKKDGVNLRDCQLFFKRLRINLQRAGIRSKIRYVLVAEYGKRTHREHYHAILWNLSADNFHSFREINKIIERSWSNGFIMSRLVEPCNDKAFFYTAKYLRKDCRVPDGCSETFILSSNRGGGIGARYLDSIAKVFRKNCPTRFEFSNRFSNKVEKLQFNRYVLNRLLPSVSRSLPVGLKRDVREFLLNYIILKTHFNYSNTYYDEKSKQIRDFFGQIFYCPLLESKEIKESFLHCEAYHQRTCLFALQRIERSLMLGRDYFGRVADVDKKRKKFLEKLFLNQYEIDVSHRKYVAKRNFELAAQRELF